MGLVEDADEVKTFDREGSIFYPIHANNIHDYIFYS